MRYPKLIKKHMMKTQITVVIESEEIDENGGPVEAFRWTGLCNYQDHAARIITNDKSTIEITGQAYIDGDIAPGLAVIPRGTVTVYGIDRELVQGCKARNPDGTVNYTRLDVR